MAKLGYVHEKIAENSKDQNAPFHIANKLLYKKQESAQSIRICEIQLALALVNLVLRKPTLDQENNKNLRPVYNLSLICTQAKWRGWV